MSNTVLGMMGSTSFWPYEIIGVLDQGRGLSAANESAIMLYGAVMIWLSGLS